MAHENLALNRQQVFYINETVAAGDTIPTTFGGAAGAYPIIEAAGNTRLMGLLVGAAAPAAGFPRIRFWDAPGDATTLTARATYPLTADPLNANTFQLDVQLYSPYVTIEWTQGTTGGNLFGIAWVYPEAGFNQGALGPQPVSLSAPATFRVAFSGIVLAGGAGQFLQLANPAASGRVLRVTTQWLSKPSATMRWTVNKLSTLSTGGTATTPTPVALDSNNTATVGVVSLYTAIPTAGGTIVGAVLDQYVTAGDTFIDEPGSNSGNDSTIVLRAAQAVSWVSDINVTFAGMIEFSDQGA